MISHSDTTHTGYENVNKASRDTLLYQLMQITDTVKCPCDEEKGDKGICTMSSRKKYQFCVSKYEAFTINKQNKV